VYRSGRYEELEGTVQIHERLRQAREASGLGLEELEKRTRIRLHLLQSLEDGQLEALPSGLYARAVVRTYAMAVGLDPEDVLGQLGTRLPGVEDPLDGLARARGIDREPARIPPAVRVDSTSASVTQLACATLADSGILCSIGILVVAASARLCGVSVDRLLQFAYPAMIAIWVLIAGLYFLLLGGLAGRTAGRWLVGLPAAVESGPLHAGQAGRRAWDLALREGSVLVELLLGRGKITEDDRPEAARFQMPAANRAGDP
jgi:transcriptional regulator with XRE-family HTH domain